MMQLRSALNKCQSRRTIPFLKRYRAAAGSARTIHDYLRPHDFHHFHDSSILPDYYPLHDPSYTHDSAMEIATGIAPHDSAIEIATGIPPASSRTRRPKLNTPAAPNSTHRN